MLKTNILLNKVVLRTFISWQQFPVPPTYGTVAVPLLHLRWGIVGELIAEAAVAPDEIALSPNVTVYDQGNN